MDSVSFFKPILLIPRRKILISVLGGRGREDHERKTVSLKKKIKIITAALKECKVVFLDADS